MILNRRFERMAKIAAFIFIIMMIMLIFAVSAFAQGVSMTSTARGIWWILTALFSCLMAYLNFSKKYQGSVPAKIMIIVNVASVVFGVLFATPWLPPAGP